MKVTKQMLHKDLQSHFAVCNSLTHLCKKKWRVKLVNVLTDLAYKGRNTRGLQCCETHIPSSDSEYTIRIRVYRPLNHDEPLPVMLYLHGGGYMTGIPEIFGMIIEKFIHTRPCVVVAPDYRKAYTQPFPAGFNDCYDTLLWAKANVEDLGILADKVIIAGHSAGGGLTAAVSLKVRDRQDATIAFQMPMYPMIDDSQPDDAARTIQSPIWDTELNRCGWNAYLADVRENGDDIPAYAAPARNADWRGMPPTITLVGTLEPFYQETLAYVEALKNANIEVAFKRYDGCFHGFDFAVPKAEVSKNAQDFTFQSYADFYDKFCCTDGSYEAGTTSS